MRTARQGAAARAGHDLVIEVTSWSATLELAHDEGRSSLELEADATSLRVREGTGGVMELGDDDRREIETNIDDEVLRRAPIRFRSSSVARASDGRLRVAGELELVGTTRPIEFDLDPGDDGRIRGNATVDQTDWGIKPYSALFGALKVHPQVEIEFEAQTDG